MLKVFLHSALMIYLLSILVNSAFAEDTVLNNKRPENTATSAVVAKEVTISSNVGLVDNKDTKNYHLLNMNYYNRIGKYYWVYIDSEEQDLDNKYYKVETGNDYTVPVSTVAGEGMKNQNTPAKADVPFNQPPLVAEMSTTSVDDKVESVQRNDLPAAQEGTFLKKEGNALQMDKIDLNSPRPRRLEASYSFDHLSPNDLYGDWHSGQLSFYNTVSPDFTYFLQGVLFNRNEGTGAMGIIGAYKGWTSYLYTCTSVSAGTHENYLPEIRFDHDFNFNVWPSNRINLLMGLSYLDYYDDHSGWVFSGGPMISIEKLSLHYRLFYNISNPGTITSFSHLISIGYGQEGWQWTYLNVSFGKQAYLATFVVPQEVNHNSLSLNLRHRHWLDKYYGIFADVSYSKLEDGYDNYGIGLGAFYEF